MTPSEVLKMAADKGAKVFDLRFLDFPGLWQHMTHPMSELTEDAFNEGFGFDGSSIRGLAGDQRQRHAGDARSHHGAHGPVHERAHPGDDLRHRGPADPRALHPRPPQHRQEG